MTDGPTPPIRHAVKPAYALLYDGTSVMIREMGPADLETVRALHHGMSPEDLYMRFFGMSARFADRTAERICRPPGPGHTALGAWSAGELVGVADYELDRPGVAEIALAVADGMHHRGVGRLLLEHLMALARARGVRTLHADTLVQNLAALRVVAATGMPVRSRFENGVIELTLSLVPDGRERARSRAERAD